MRKNRVSKSGSLPGLLFRFFLIAVSFLGIGILAFHLFLTAKKSYTQFLAQRAAKQYSTVTDTSWRSDLQAYSGCPYQILNENRPYFSGEELTTVTFESYSDLDSLGRCGTAAANICPELMPTEERGAIGEIRPTGWHTVKYDFIENKYLYNRCHLIGYSLAGENSNKKNLITGTRYMNIEGMLPFEIQVCDYVEDTGNHVLYRVTPDFSGENLLANGVLMEAESVEDGGAGVQFCVYCYNVQPGVLIDYSNGYSEIDPDYDEGEGAVTSDASQSGGDSASDHSAASGSDTSGQSSAAENSESDSVFTVPDCAYVLNTSSMKIHLPTCVNVPLISSRNYAESDESLEELKSEGYTPCKNCLPGK